MGRTMSPLLTTLKQSPNHQINSRSTDIESLLTTTKSKPWYMRLISLFVTVKEPEYKMPVSKPKQEYFGESEGRQFIGVDTSTNSRMLR